MAMIWMSKLNPSKMRTLLLYCWLLPLAQSIPLIIGGVQQNLGGSHAFDNVRFHFRFGVEEGTSVHEEDIHAVLCRTQDFLEEVMYQEFAQQMFEVKAKGIKWDVNPEDPLPIEVSFTAVVSGANGTILESEPTHLEILEATEDMDMANYLANYAKAAKCEDAFMHATQAEYENKQAPEINGDIPEAICTMTCAPTLSPGVPTGKLFIHTAMHISNCRSLTLQQTSSCEQPHQPSTPPKNPKPIHPRRHS